MPIRILPLLAALPLLATPSSAQHLTPGARVRVRPPCPAATTCAPVIGVLRFVSPDSVEVTDTAGILHALPLTATTRLDVSRGYRRLILEGLGLGLVAGTVAGAVAQASCSGGRIGHDSDCGLWYIVTVPSGVLLGGIVGAHLKTEWWLPPPERRLVIAPSGDGWRVGMAMRW